MRKIPTLFLRDPDDMRRVTPDVHPDCKWVLDGEGTPTRKYDGTCVMFDGAHWWARREVKPGKATPVNFQPVMTDDATGKTLGWEPIEQSAFAKFHTEALAGEQTVIGWPNDGLVAGGTYELVGPKVNGNPEQVDRHMLVRHGYRAAVDEHELDTLPLDYEGLRGWLLAHPQWEGVVWHHPDGRMSKLKRRDFPTA